MKQVLVACDSFKGSLTSAEITRIAVDVFRPFQNIKLVVTPFADGGEGSLDCVASVTDGVVQQVVVPNLFGQLQSVCYIISDNHAFIEVASVCGMHHLAPQQLNPCQASSQGVGYLIRHAVECGCSSITLFLGGTATIDGGTGMLRSLGVEFMDCCGTPISSGNPLLSFAKICWGNVMNRLQGIHFDIVCDVVNPIMGPMGGVKIFGPQKGLQYVDVEKFEHRLCEWLQQLEKHTDAQVKNLETEPFGGAAGGIGLPFLGRSNTSFHIGFEWFRQKLKLDLLIRNSDLVITGEGRIDHQTHMGKGVGRIAQLCRSLGKPVVGICGSTDGSSQLFNQIFILGDGLLPYDESMNKASQLFAGELLKIATLP